MKTGNIVRSAWRELMRSFNESFTEKTEEIERAIGFARLREQLWDALDSSEEVSANGWAYPIDVYAEDTGSLFSIVTQAGKLFKVPITVASEQVSLGPWEQVTEVFQPVTQSKNRFSITRDKKTGKHRWLFVAATSVINRVGEIDSSTLFDSFIQHAAETGEYPRVDFYHLGGADPDKWEFGTADYLARDGCCYITTGTFDEDHPLARAAIKAYEADPEKWGCSIEFYANGEPEIIMMDPQVKVPVYKDGINTRISIVKEVDAAGLFTRVANITEEKVRMKRDIMDVLKEFFADDEEALNSFAEGVDSINRTVSSDKLISRAKAVKAGRAPGKKDEEDPEEEEVEEDEDAEDTEDEDQDDDAPLELDDEAIQQVASQVMEHADMKAIQQSISDLKASLEEAVKLTSTQAQRIEMLEKDKNKLAQRVKSLEKDDDTKLQEKVEDLPARSRRVATYRRPSEIHGEVDEGEEENLAVISKRTLQKLPSYNNG